MKIGILTFHREENFGASLQAYALLSFLKQNGFDTEIIDYDPKYRSDNRKILPPVVLSHMSLQQKIKMLISIILNIRKILKYKTIFKNFQKSFLNITGDNTLKNINKANTEYDIVVCGSDQIWQPFLANNGKFDKAYFYGYPKAKRHLSYGASMGNINMLTEKNTSIFINYISHVDKIIVREKDLCTYINKLGYNAIQVCDPVFLLKKSFWEEFKNKSTIKTPPKYILVHRANKYLVDKIEKNIQYIYKCPIVYIDKKKLGKNYINIKITSLSDVLNLISNAEFVITSSFHVTAFSLIFDKKFVTYNKNPERALSITEALGVKERCIKTFDQNILSNIINTEKSINYEKNEFIIQSQQTLLDVINKKI